MTSEDHAMVLEILIIVDLFLWFLSLLPVAPVAAYGWATSWLAWIAVLLLALFLFIPGLR
jgi:hypothetical protein